MSFKVVSTCNIAFVVKGLGEHVMRLAGVEFVDKPSFTEEDIIAAAGDADAVVVGAEPYNRKVITNLKNCRLISTPKMGYDNIDVAAATEAGICASCVSDASVEEVSDHAMALLLACARKVVKMAALSSCFGPVSEQALNKASPGRPKIRTARAMHKLRFITSVLASSMPSHLARLLKVSFKNLPLTPLISLDSNCEPYGVLLILCHQH
jgi:hypothetical protein